MSEGARPVSNLVAGRALSLERNLARLLAALFADVAVLARYVSWNTHDARDAAELLDRLDRVQRNLDHVQLAAGDALGEAHRLIDVLAEAQEVVARREAEAGRERRAA